MTVSKIIKITKNTNNTIKKIQINFNQCVNFIPIICSTIKVNPVGDKKDIKDCPNIKVLITIFLGQLTLSAKGAKTGIDKTAKPELDGINIPKMIKAINAINAKIILGNPSRELVKLFKKVS